MTGLKVMKYELRNVLRSRWVLVYALLLVALTDALFRFGGSGEKAALSLMNVVLILTPLVSLVFGTMYLYNAREFIELFLAQPVSRRSLFLGLYGGLSVPLAVSYLAGVGIPFLAHGGAFDAARPFVVLLGTGVILTFVFTAIAFWLSLRFTDRAMGLGAAILIWLACSVLYDALVLFIVSTFGDYPLELPMLGLTMLNPVDLGRVLLLLHFDIAALMGYTGAVFERFFGTAVGVVVSVGVLVVWWAVPFWRGFRRFGRRDF